MSTASSKAFRQCIRAQLQERRPSLSSVTLDSYSSSLNSLYKKVFPAQEYDLQHFHDVDAFTEHLKEMDPKKRRTYYCHLYVLTGEEEYARSMQSDVQEYSRWLKQNKKTETQRENWVTQAEVRERWNEMTAVWNRLRTGEVLTPERLKFGVHYVLLSLFALQAPRRAMDVTELRWDNNGSDNYYTGKHLVYRRYKTARTYGEQREEVAPALKKVLDKWQRMLRANGVDSGHVLFGSTGRKLQSVQVNQYLNAVFAPKRASVNALRHSYITQRYEDGVTMREMKKLAEDMGHSVAEQMNYVKE